MKKIILILTLSLLAISCDVNDDSNYSFQLNPVYQVEMPSKFAKDSITNIPVKYLSPSTCHVFNNFYYDAYQFDRIVAIETVKLNQNNCQADNETVVEVQLKFRPVTLGTYHFKFWTGENDLGEDQYLEYNVVVDH